MRWPWRSGLPVAFVLRSLSMYCTAKYDNDNDDDATLRLVHELLLVYIMLLYLKSNVK
jgi:hypothetical protein